MGKLKGFFSSLFKNKKVLIPIIVLAVGLLIIFTARYVLAQRSFSKNGKSTQNSQTGKNNKSDKTSNAKKSPGKIADNKKRTTNTTTKRDPEKILNSSIDSAKKNGSIDDGQAKKIQDKRQEVKKFNDSIKNRDDSEYMKLVAEKKQELREWAISNSIPIYFINMIMRAN